MSIFNYNNKVFSRNNKIFKTIWKPNKINGIEFWGDSNIKNIRLNDGLVYDWIDISGKMNNATQDFTAYLPTIVENVINDYSSLYFQDNKYLKLPLYLNQFTIFTVIKSNDNGVVYSFGNNATGFYLSGEDKAISTNKIGYSIKKNSNNWLSGNWKILTHQYNGTHSSHKLYVNNSNINLGTYMGYDFDPGLLSYNSVLNIGSKSDGINGVNAYIAEYIVYNNYLSYDEISMVNNYLNNKYLIY
jgi:hypothetical protein